MSSIADESAAMVGTFKVRGAEVVGVLCARCGDTADVDDAEESKSSVSFWDVNPGAFWVWVDCLLVIVAGRPAVGCARVGVEIELLARVD